MQFLFSPFQGALSDSFGRRPVILISNFGVGLDYVLMALAPTLPWLFVGRVISGITAASISTSYAYVTDVTPPDQRAGRFGLLGAAFGAGFVLGPALGGLAGSVSPRLPFWIAAGLSLANAFYGLLILPESFRDRAALRLRLPGSAPIRSAPWCCYAPAPGCWDWRRSISSATSRMRCFRALPSFICSIAITGIRARSA
jgi:MFS transporter, DHA1 family, tetracycline resistance protein